jgi:hypothetical protein
VCSRRPPRHHLSTIGVLFIGNEAATRRGLGGPGGLANGREWGCQHFATQYQLEHQVTVAAVSACVLMAEEAVRWVSPKPTLASRFLATRTGRRHTPRQSNPHSGCASSLRYTGTCSATAVQPAHQCLNVPPFVVAGHGELSWPRGQALGPGNSRFSLSNNPATADLRLGGGPWESWRSYP